MWLFKLSIFILFNMPGSITENVRRSVLKRPPLQGGHSPFYDAASNSVFFVDSMPSTVYRYFIDSRRTYNMTLGTKDVSFIIPIEGTIDKYLVAYGNDLAVLQWDFLNGKASFRTLGLSDPNHPYPQYIANEAKVGRTKTKPLFYYSTTEKVLANYTHHSSLLNLVNGKKKALVSGLNRGKGFGFSKDGKTFFYSDIARNRTFRACYNEGANKIENVTMILNYTELGIAGHPDALTVDAEGYVWFANMKDRLLKVNPYNGAIECSIKLPTTHGPTGLTFGKCPHTRNDDLDCIYTVTITNGEQNTTTWDGALILVEGVKSSGVLDYKVPLSTIYGRAQPHY